MDGLVRIYASDATQGIVLRQVLDAGVDAECCWIDWHPRGSVLIAGFGSGSIWMWRISLTAEAQVMAVFASPVTGVPVTCGQFTSDGKGVVAGAADGSVYLLSPKSQLACVARHVPAPHHTMPLGECSTLAMHPQSPLLMVGDITGHVKVFKLPLIEDSMQQQQQQSLPVPLIELSHGHVQGQSIESCAFHPAGQFALSAGMDGRVLFYDASTSYSVRSQFTLCDALPAESDELRTRLDAEGVVLARWTAAFANGLALPTEFIFSVLLGSSLGRLCLVDGRTGRVLRKFQGRLGVPVLDASLSVGGILVVAFDDGSINEYQI
jgi:ribosome assembly protein SQT1